MSLQLGKDKAGAIGAGFGIMTIVGGLAFSELASAYLQSTYGPLLNLLGVRLGADAAQLNWISAAYLLSSVVCVPVLAKLGDLYGHKRMVIITLVIVTVGTVIAAFATTFPLFLSGMLVQGAVSALLPLEMAIVRERAGDQASKGIGLLVGCLGGGAVVGILLTGLLGTVLDLTLVMLIPAVLLVLSLLIIILTVPETQIRSEGRIDWKGASLLGIGLALVLYAISNGKTLGWLSPIVLGMTVVGLALLVLFVRVEKTVRHPLIDIKLVTRGGVGFYLILMLLFGIQQLGSGPVNSLYVASKPSKVGYGFGLDSLGVSLTLVPYALMLMIGAVVGHALVRRMGQMQTLIWANVLVIAKYAMLIVFSGDLAIFTAAQFVGGLGVGIFIAVLPAIIVGLAPKDASGIAGAMYNTTRTLAGAVGGAVFAAIMSAMFLPTTKVPSVDAFLVIWAVCGGLSVMIMAFLPFSRHLGRVQSMLSDETLEDPDLGLVSQD